MCMNIKTGVYIKIANIFTFQLTIGRKKIFPSPEMKIVKKKKKRTR